MLKRELHKQRKMRIMELTLQAVQNLDRLSNMSRANVHYDKTARTTKLAFRNLYLELNKWFPVEDAF